MRRLRFSWAVGRRRHFRCSPHRRDVGLTPSSCRLRLHCSAIPAFFCHSGESRNPAQIQRGTRTLQHLAERPSLKRSAKRALYTLDSRPCSSQGQALRGNGEVGAWEWRSRLYSLDVRRVFTQPGKPESRAKRARNAHILKGGVVRMSRFSCLRLRNGLWRRGGRGVQWLADAGCMAGIGAYRCRPVHREWRGFGKFREWQEFRQWQAA